MDMPVDSLTCSETIEADLVLAGLLETEHHSLHRRYSILRLSDNGVEKARISMAGQEEGLKQPVAEINQNLLDEWEKGWDDTNVTDEDLMAATSNPGLVAEYASLPSSSTSTPESTLSSKKVLPSTTKPQSSNVRPREGSTENNLSKTCSSSEPQAAEQPGYWGKWGGWGSSLVGHVGQGFTAVMETVEQSLGAPKPEELAAMNAATVEEVWNLLLLKNFLGVTTHSVSG